MKNTLRFSVAAFNTYTIYERHENKDALGERVIYARKRFASK